MSQCRCSQTRVKDEAGTRGSKPSIINVIFLLVKSLLCTFGTKEVVSFFLPSPSIVFNST